MESLVISLRSSRWGLLGAAACLVAVVAAAAAIASPQPFAPIYPMVSPDGKQLAWVEGQTWRIWVADPDGTNAHTYGPGFAANGIGQISWTPIGMIVDSNYTLFVIRPDGTRTRITTVADQTFSVGGTRVAVDGGQAGLRATVTNLQTRKTIRIGKVAPTLSPDGARLAWTSFTAGVWVANASGHTARKIAPRGGGCLAWAPNGRSVAYLVPAGNRLELQVTPTAGGPSRTVARGLTGCNLSWSPDGTQIGLASARLVVVNLANGSVTRSPLRIGRIAGGFSWSHDSRTVYVTARPFADEAAGNNCTSLWQLDVRSLAAKALVRGCT
jgi:Tol biopolymer transport system component